MRLIMLFVVGLVVAVFVALSQVNLESLRGQVLAALRNSTGMAIEIDGDVSWKFSLRPHIELHDVRIPNEDWARHKYAFSAERVDVRLNLLSLLHNRPTIQNVSVYDATVAIEKNKNGDLSVKMLPDKNADDASNGDTTDEGQIAEKEQPLFPFTDAGLGGLEIKNLVAHIMGKTYSLASFSVRYMMWPDVREYGGWVKFDKESFPFIVSFSEYNAERKVYPVRVAISTGGQALIANVALEGKSLLPIDFVIKGDVPDMTFLGRVLDVDLENVPPISVNLSGGYTNDKITLRKSSLNFRDTDFDVSGSVDWSGVYPAINLDLKSNRVDVRKTFPELYGDGNWTRPNRDLNVFRDMDLHGSELLNKNIKLHIAVGNLIVYRDINLRNVDVSISLRDAHARVDGSMNFAGGNVRVGGDIDVNQSGQLDVVVGLMGRDVSVGKLMEQIRINDLISDLPMNIEFYGRASGSDMSEVMRTLTGPIKVYSTNSGYAHSALVANVYGTDFLTSLRHGIQDLFSSSKKHDQIKISCAVVNTILRNGRAETRRGVALESNAIDVLLAGNVDLGQETIGLSLTTVPVRGLKLSLTGNVVNSIEITGNLAEPDIKISGAAVAGKVASATGLGLLLTPLTGGLSLLAGAGVGLLAGDLLESWLADDHPCRTALERGARVNRDDPQWLQTPVTDLVNGVLNNKGVK